MAENATFNNGYFCPALFPNKKAPIATATMTIVTIPVVISSVDSEDVVFFTSACDGETEGDKLGEVLDVFVDDAVVREGGGDCIEVGAGVGIGVFRLDACGFGAVKNGVKVTCPKVKSWL